MLRFYCLVLLFSSGTLSAAAQLHYYPFGTAPAGTNDQLTVRPGSLLHLQAENINPLKYKVTVTSTYFTQEFSSAPASTAPASTAASSPSSGPPSGGGVGASVLAEKALIAQAAVNRFSTIQAHYSAYNKVVGEVNKLYAADIWPANVAATFMTEAASAFDGRENVITAGEFVSRLNLWHTQLLSAIDEYTTQTTAFAAEIATQQAELRKATIELNRAQQAFNNAEKALKKNAQSTPLRERSKAAGTSLRDKQNKVAAINSTLGDARRYASTYPVLTFSDPAKELADKLKLDLDQEAKQPLLPTLASAYIAMRTITTPRPLPSALMIPQGKDELDLEIKLELRPTYQQPPGTSLSVPDSYKRTLFIVPRFRVTASVGPYVGGLFDHQFVLANDSLRQEGPPASGSTAPTVKYSPRRRIVRENVDQKFDYVGATVLTHFEYHLRPSFGVALSLGAGLQTSGFRALLGPSVLFGSNSRAVISGGVQLGQVKRLSQVYAEGDKVPVSVQAVPTRDVNATSWFTALTYNLSSTRK
ncbi:MAG: hypothetical protein ACRYG7_20105 [Janthinobacterium lividum]